MLVNIILKFENIFLIYKRKIVRMKYIKSYEFFEHKISEQNKKLAIEIEFKFRTKTKDELKKKTIFEIIKELGFDSGQLSGVDLGQILKYQMTFNKLTDEEFLKFYNEYKKNPEN